MKPLIEGILAGAYGVLSEAVSCHVVEERNGQFELEMVYPVDGAVYDKLQVDRIIRAKPNETASDQMFRIYKISVPFNGMVTVNAHHISYDLTGIPVKPFTATGVANALNGLVSNAMLSSNFTVWTDLTNTTSQFNLETMGSFREWLGGTDGSVLDTFGGEYEWDNFDVKLHAQRGSDNHVRIAYGKNLTDLNKTSTVESMYTGVVGYWANEETTVYGNIQYASAYTAYPGTSTSGNIQYSSDSVVLEPGNYENADQFILLQRIKAVDFSGEFETKPTVAQLNEKAQFYITSNGYGIPKLTVKASFVPLWDTEEYKDIAPLEHVSLCDIVTVYHPKYEVDITTKVIRTDFDVLQERYISITLGDVTLNLNDTINRRISNSLSAVNAGITKANASINNLNTSVTTLNNNVSTLNTDVSTLNTDVTAINTALAKGLDLSSVLFFGDSFTQGYGLDNPNSQTYCAFFASLMGITRFQRFGGGGCGFSHVSASLNMNLLQYWNSVKSQIRTDTKTVFLMAGYNDKDQTDANIATGMGNLKDAIKSLLPNAKIVYMFNPTPSVTKRATVESCYFYARRNEFITIHSYWWQLFQTSEYQSDYVHPKDTANNTIAKMLRTQLLGGTPHHSFTLQINSNIYLDAIDDKVVVRVTYAKDNSSRAANIGSFPSWFATGWNSSRTGPDRTYTISAPINDSTGANHCFLLMGANSSSIFACSMRNISTPSAWSSGTMNVVQEYSALDLLG